MLFWREAALNSVRQTSFLKDKAACAAEGSGAKLSIVSLDALSP